MLRGSRCCFGVWPAPPGVNIDEYVRWGLEEEWTLMRLQPQGDIYETRLALRQKLPFRVETCTTCPMLCCGLCGKPCATRCVQDLLHRSWSICASVNESSPPDMQMFKKLVQTPGITYKQLCELFSQFLTTDHNRRLKEFPSHPYTQDYAPAFKNLQRRSSDGKIIYSASADPETGIIEVYEWPESGLCPYCIPYRSATLSKEKRYESRTNRPRR